jgi:hypothetical protein
MRPVFSVFRRIGAKTMLNKTAFARSRHKCTDGGDGSVYCVSDSVWQDADNDVKKRRR